MRLIISFGVVASFVGSWQVSASELEACIYETYGPSIGMVTYAYTGSNGEHDEVHGSGFLISSDGHVLTSNHVLRPLDIDPSDVTVETVTVQLGTYYATSIPAAIIKRSPDEDLALLKLPTSSTGSLAPLPIGASSGLKVGEELTAAGFPMGDISVSQKSQISSPNALVSGVLKPWWQTSLPLNPGNSGGPVFNDAGTVIGIAEAVRDEAQMISYVVPIQYAGELLKYAGATAEVKGPCDFRDVMDKKLAEIRIGLDALNQSLLKTDSTVKELLGAQKEQATYLKNYADQVGSLRNSLKRSSSVEIEAGTGASQCPSGAVMQGLEWSTVSSNIWIYCSTLPK